MGLNTAHGTFPIQVSPRRAARLARLTTVGSVAALFLIACGGGTGDGASGGTTVSTPAGGEAEVVTVVEKEFSIELSETRLTPGTYTFRVDNQGSSPHDFAIKGPGMDTEKSPDVNGGETTELTVTLHPGTYQVWCSVDEHRAKGMDTTITVS